MPKEALEAASMPTTIDPLLIKNPSDIPPQGAQFIGVSPKGLVEVHCGTLSGDVDAQPAAQELLGTSLDTSGVANADYIYAQVSTLYGGADLPSFPSPEGNMVKSVVFVSGSPQGGYGAFHGGNNQEDFDRIVVDSLNASGNYSAGSGFSSMAPLKAQKPHLFPLHRGPSDLLGVLHSADKRLRNGKPAAMRLALNIARASGNALSAALQKHDGAAVPDQAQPHALSKNATDEQSLVHANQVTAGLLAALTRAGGGRQYLSTALFCAEIVESFQMLTHKANPGLTDGEAVSRVLGYKLAPEVAMVPGFNSGETQEWWQGGHPDYVSKDNTQSDLSSVGNGAGVMFLLFLNDFLGIPLDAILAAMPDTDGAALGDTYVALLPKFPALGPTAGATGKTAFDKMIALLQQHTRAADGSLNLPANGNPFPSMPGAKQGGLFTAGAGPAPTTGTLAQGVQAAMSLEQQVEQQLASLRAALQHVQADLFPAPAGLFPPPRRLTAEEAAAFNYGPPLVSALAKSLEQQVEPFRASQFDETLRTVFWRHVYNELPNTGKLTNRLQVITGTIPMPLAVQITGTVQSTKQEDDGDMHIRFQPDDPAFPHNHDPQETPLEIEIIYAYAPKPSVPPSSAQQAEGGFTDPFDPSQLGFGTRIQAAGPLIYDRAHGRPSSDGQNVDYGLEIHPLVGLTILSGTPAPGPAPAPEPAPGPAPAPAPAPAPEPAPVPAPAPASTLTSDLGSAAGQAASLAQAIANLSALLQKLQGEAPTQ
jgi:hypothetical protein